MCEHIVREIRAAVIKLENQLAQLDGLQNRKRTELEQYRRALRVVCPKASSAVNRKPAQVIPIRVVQLKSVER